MKNVYVIVGTRPEAIKMAPVYKALLKKPELRVRLISTGQHRSLLMQSLQAFGLTPDFELEVMRPAQTLSGVTARILLGLEQVFSTEVPDVVLAHGDTTTCYSAALSAFYHKIPFFHVEAGLRSYRLDSPFPEEFNRQTIVRFTTRFVTLKIRHLYSLSTRVRMPGRANALHQGGQAPPYSQLLRKLRPKIVFTHSSSDLFPDHKIVRQLTEVAVTAAGGPWYPEAEGNPHRVSKVYGYEVWNPIQQFQCAVDITSTLDQKLGALRCHKSQMEAIDYASAVQGLAQYRGAMSSQGK